ncbi:sulfite exporter TauE/SafE family protein [Nocardioides sp. JQ2195]|uniref:sulfite exporter TauE/SafE family protein n=1 Tax=Nocardioides sp. JQ2195 TaxID=2592334 RepID=UPI00143ECC9E|nr:sulfite exporter TauE/SafE family protein [Nocardioides sp. JQ2195]QIX25641.1 sulfite exporter TauE/SafE family protein [Nocardioides sp. JQ2195]
MPDLTLLAAAVAVFALAATAQAVSGFGGAMLAIPLLLLLGVDPATAVAAATGVSLLMSARAWHRERDHVEVQTTRRLVVAGLLGMPLGLLALLVLDEGVLARGIGVLILVTVALTAFRVRLPASRSAHWAAGGLSGALLTSTGMNGPPLVLALTGTQLSARRIRATLQAVFAVQDVVAVGLFVVAGVLGLDALLLVVAGALGVPLGWAVGDRVFHRLSETTFRRIVLVGLVAVALAAFTQGA